MKTSTKAVNRQGLLRKRNKETLLATSNSLRKRKTRRAEMFPYSSFLQISDYWLSCRISITRFWITDATSSTVFCPAKYAAASSFTTARIAG